MAEPSPTPPSGTLDNRGQIPPDRIDPDVVLPPGVIAARERANAAYQSAYGGGANGGGGDNPPAPGAPGAQATPAQVLIPPNGAAPAVVQEELPETNPDGSTNWENRFKALKGRYEADTRRSREIEQRLGTLTSEVEQLRSRPAAQEADLVPPQLLSQKEIEEYGPDLVDVIKRAAQEAVMPMFGTLAKEVGHLKGRADNTENETGRQFLVRMNGAMDATVPGWDEINRDPRFIDWTKRNDVYSGLNRQEMLQKAWYAGDSNRVAAFFRGFLAEEAATDPAAADARQRAMAAANGGHAPYPGTGAGPASPSPAQAPRVTLESLAAPGRARAAVAPPAGKPVWTADGISQFYLDCAQGKFRGREAERAATEADLMSAQREGRIVVNPRTATTLQGH